MKSNISRRSALAAIGAMPLLSDSITAEGAALADSHLLALGRLFDAATAKDDHNAPDFYETWEHIGRLTSEIATIRAITLQGMCVKARVACWARLGDLEYGFGSAQMDDRMALSIVSDLIRLYFPNMERPGVLAELVNHD